MTTYYPSELHKIVAEATNLAPSTQEKYLRDLNAWIAFAGAAPAGWTRQRAQDFYVHLTKTQKLRPQSANRLMASVAFASRWRAHLANQPELDFVKVMKGKGARKLPKHALEEAQARALLDTCALDTAIGKRDFALMVLALETGMRVMSLVAARVDNISMGTKVRPFPAIAIIEKGSGGEPRDVPLSDTAVAALAPWRDFIRISCRTKGPMFQPIHRGIGSQPVLSDRALSQSAIKLILSQRGVAAGIGHVNPHMFRHTFVTWRMAAGLAPHEVAAVTGHALNLGALGGYIDERALGEKVRASTPPWLVAYVAERVK